MIVFFCIVWFAIELSAASFSRVSIAKGELFRPKTGAGRFPWKN